jgi:hypothetical protein
MKGQGNPNKSKPHTKVRLHDLNIRNDDEMKKEILAKFTSAFAV